MISNNNHIGYFHQNIFNYMGNGWTVPKQGFDVVNEVYKGLDHKIVLAIDHSNGSDGIIASSKIKSITDAKGKRIAFEGRG